MTGQIHYLAWDTEFFGLRTGRLNCQDEQEASEALQKARQTGYELVYVFCEEALTECTLDPFGGIDVGGEVTFEKPLDRNIGELFFPSRISTIDDAEPSNQLLNLAYLSGTLSRFRIDASLPSGSFERLYYQWLINDLNGENTAVMTRGSRMNPEGFITANWKNDQCHIGLLSVRRDQQGAGLGSDLLKAIEAESYRRGVTRIVVKTQAVNQPACSLYSRNGYREKQRNKLYHFHWHCRMSRTS